MLLPSSAKSLDSTQSSPSACQEQVLKTSTTKTPLFPPELRSTWYVSSPSQSNSIVANRHPQNAWAADFDSMHFKDPSTFSVERYLENPEGSGTPHYAYGAGSRMCAGSHLANRELYTAFIRLFTAFHIDPPKEAKDRPILDSLECNAIPTSLTTDPKPFKCGFRARDRAKLEEWMRESEERTKDL
jgi:hypothetical protein